MDKRKKNQGNPVKTKTIILNKLEKILIEKEIKYSR